jgi:hypothetical protein
VPAEVAAKLVVPAGVMAQLGGRAPATPASPQDTQAFAACAGDDTITVTRNEILFSLNKPEDFILALVEFGEGTGKRSTT